MFGWLRKSSKEPTGANEPHPLEQPPSVHANYVHVDDAITPKPLDPISDDIDDDNKDYADRPHSVTAARPFFQAQQHLEQQQMKQEVIQSNYMSDNEDNYIDQDEIDIDDDMDNDQDKKDKKKWGLFKNKKDKDRKQSSVKHKKKKNI